MLEDLLEVIVYVDEMDRQVEFYRDTLDLTVSHPAGRDDFADVDWVTFETGACTLALHSGGTSEAADGAPELVFEVDDLESARSKLRERGVEVGEIREPAPGIRVCGARDPEGNPFSLESRESD